MTRLFFVRHAQPEHGWADDRTRPLTPQGMADTAQVRAFFEQVQPDAAYSSPYRRSMDTIRSAAEYWGLDIRTDERLREREGGPDGSGRAMIERRWADRDFHEAGGESIRMVQERNVAAVLDILAENQGKTVMIGTHGTALSSIINHFEPDFGCAEFFRLKHRMPCIVELDFAGQEYLGKKEHLFITRP